MSSTQNTIRAWQRERNYAAGLTARGTIRKRTLKPRKKTTELPVYVTQYEMRKAELLK
jgi:hypothetical protein